MLLLLAAVLLATTLDPVRLSVFNKHYVSVVVGTPGTRIKFFVNLTHNDVHISRSLYDRSQSFFASTDGTSGSESFFFGNTRVRLPVKFTAIELDRSLNILQPVFDGVLGLGPLSPLWLYWSRVTLTPRCLYLGELRTSALLNTDENPPVLPLQDVWSNTGPVAIHPYSLFSFVPDDDYHLDKKSKVFGHADLCNLLFNGKCLGEKLYKFGRLPLIGAHGMTIDPVVVSNEGLRLGLEFFETHVVLIDRAQNAIAFSESIYSFQEYSFPSWAMIFVSTLMISYVMIEFLDGTIVRGLEFYGLLWIAFSFINLVAGMDISRHIRDYCELTHAWPVILYVGFYVVLLLAKIPFPIRELRYLERHLFVNASMLIIWMCSVEEHQTMADVTQLLFIATLHGIYTAFTACDGYARKMPLWGIAGILFVLYVPFLLSSSFFPAMMMSGYTNWIWLYAALYVLLAVVTPAWILQVEISKVQQ